MEELTQMFHSYYRNRINIPRPRKGFYPSETSLVITNRWNQQEVVGKCLRQVYWRWNKEPGASSVSPQTEFKFALGKYSEAAVIDLAKLSGVFIDNNVKFTSEDLHVSGEVDMIVKLPDLGITGIEVKSIWGYNGIQGTIHSSRTVAFFPKVEHLLQVICYIHHFTQESELQIPLFKIFYLARDTAETGEHNIRLDAHGNAIVNGTTYTQYNVQAIKRRIDEFFEYLNNDELPPRDYNYQYTKEQLQFMKENDMLNKKEIEQLDRNRTAPVVADFQCRYCDYQQLCREVGGGLRFPDTICEKG